MKKLEGIRTKKRCPQCGKTKRVSQFYTCRGRYDGFAGYCKACMLIRGKRNSAKPGTKKKRNAWKRQYVKVRPEEMKERERATRRKYWKKYSADPQKRAEINKKAYAYMKSIEGQLIRKKSYLKYRYGISLQTYQTMLKKQKGRCAICNVSFVGAKRHPDVDHDHITGEVRGLLCPACNRMLGNVSDNAQILLAGIRYLTKHGRK